MPAQHTPVAILGAGLTGLSAAYHLQDRGLEHRVFERRSYPGGHVITVEEQGFRFDRTGHLLHLRTPEMRQLALRFIGDDYETVQRRSMIWSNGVYTRYPYQANTFGLPPQIAYECLLGFFQAKISAPDKAPETFEDFCLQHFGEGFSKHFMIPYNCRLWGVHPREITAAWCSRFVPLPKVEDVLAGAVGLAHPELGYNTQFIYPRRGIGVLSENMAKALAHIEYQRAPKAIDAAKKQLHFDDGLVLGYEALISSAPLSQLCALLTDPPAEVQHAASQLRCNALYYLDVALNVPVGQPLHWVYVPEERYPFYRVGCYSNFSSALAPEGKACLYVELADRKEPDLTELGPRVAEGLVEMGFIARADEIAFMRVRKIDYAYVIFDHAYFAAVERVQSYLQSHGILSTGRYGGWNYSSMEDALLFGRDAANTVSELVR